MINLSGKPFYLTANQIKLVNKMISKMTLEEKIGQIFCPIGSSIEEEDLINFISQYKPGAMMYRPQNSKVMKRVTETLQKASNIPLLLASNLESGGNGLCTDGTYFGRQMAVAATNDKSQAYKLGYISSKEANAVGGNWAFAPIVDIDYNYLNPITNIRTYGSDVNKIKDFALEQIKGFKENNIIPCIKHFPGDGVDDRDQHLLSSVNDLSVEDWDNSYGEIYKSLIDSGVETLMVGHILLPEYIKHINPDINDEDIMPASLSKEVLVELLRNKLGYNGMVVTDATPMIGYNVAMSRREALPLTIENGCDMILFNKDIDEDYEFMREGISNGLLSMERLDQAVTRILATKFKNKLFEKQENSTSLEVIGCEEHKTLAYECAKKAITLVKNKENVLPITPNKHKRVRLYHLQDRMTGGFKEEGSTKSVKELLEKEGFVVDMYDYSKLNFHEIFGTGLNYLTEQYDLVIYLAEFDTASNYTTRRIEWIKLMAADAPWFVNDIPTIFISLANPYHLLDVPMIKTYINSYSCNDESIDSLVRKLVGKEEFEGVSPVDAFCGKWDTKR